VNRPVLTGRTLVVQRGDSGGLRWLETGSELPEWADGLVGEHLLDRSEPVVEVQSDPGGEIDPDKDQVPLPVPNRGGANSSAAVWSAYAGSLGVKVGPGANRDDIIRDLDEAGFPTI
jgi:hypothetical protein